MALQTIEQGKTKAPPADQPTSSSFWRVSKRLLGRDWPVGFLFVAPTVILLFGLIGYPLLDALRLSFYNVTGVTNRGWVGLDNYERLWNDRQFRSAVWNTVQFAAISVFIKFWLGLLAAILLNKKGLRFASVFTGLVLLPWIIPEVVAALTWRGLYDPIFGGLNVLLLELGIIDEGIVWLGDYNLALPSVIAVNVWKGIPFFTIILLAGLKAIDNELYDAASVDGANGWTKFRDITLPGLRYVIVVACLLSIIFTLNAFGLVYLLTGGGPGGATRLFSILSYEYALGQMRYSLGVAVAMAIVPALLILIVILGRFMRADDAQPNEHPSVFSKMLSGIFWPIGKIGSGLVWLLSWFVFPFVWLAEKVGEGIHSAYVGGDTSKEGAYRKATQRFGNAMTYLTLVVLLLFLLFPFYWLIVTS
ncbi:MAG TPA: sugar ABC transporter permease, partial [Thermomicrobiales bacterium]|nr:sugar ABC transporter permease [Thermomicrobiales bacterium]